MRTSADTRPPGGREPALTARALGLLRGPIPFVALLAAAAATWAIAGSHQVFPYLSDNHDEAVYLLQADAFSEGRLFASAPEPAEAFTPWFGYEHNGSFVTVFPPVNSAMIAFAKVMFGSERAAHGLYAAAAIVLLFLLAREVLRRSAEAVLAAAFLAASPVFLVPSMTFLPYVPFLVLVEAFLLLFLRATRLQSRRWMAAAGLAFGVALFARSSEAVMVVLPMAVYAIVSGRRTIRQLAGDAAALAGGAAAPLGAMIAYNKAATGAALMHPLLRYSPDAGPGFGFRRQSPVEGGFEFTLAHGLQAVTGLTALTLLWSFGGLLLVALAHAGFGRRRHPVEPYLAAFAVTIPLVYVFYFGGYTTVAWGLARLLGPYYFLPIMIPLSIFGASGFVRLWRRHAVWALAAALAMAVWSGVVLHAALADNLAITRDNRAVYRPFEQADLDQALVFVPVLYAPHLLHPLAALRNSPGHDGPVVYALDRGRENFAVLDRFGDRTPYRFRLDAGYRTGAAAEASDAPSLERLLRLRGSVLTLPLVVHNRTPFRRVVVTVTMANARTVFTLDLASSAGKTYRRSLRLGLRGVSLVGGVSATGVTPLDEPAPEIVVTLAAGPNEVGAMETLEERRVPYRRSQQRLELVVAARDDAAADPAPITLE